MPQEANGDDLEPEAPRARSRRVPVLGGIAGAAQMPLILIFADYYLSRREPGVEHFALGILLGAFLGVLVGAKLTGPIEPVIVRRSFMIALLCGTPASLFCGVGLMMGGGSPDLGAIVLAIHVAAQWTAITIYARRLRRGID